MSIAVYPYADYPIVIRGVPDLKRMTRDEFFDFCRENPDMRIERSAQGDVSIMTPTGGETGRRNGEITAQLVYWSKQDGTGIVFDSSTEFWLPNGAARSPDASWICRDRWDALSQKDREKFPPLAPDFVIELRSPSDRVVELQEKMREYADNGVRLGWLIDPTTRQVEIYRPGQPSVAVANSATLSGDPELPGFVLDLTPIWCATPQGNGGSLAR